MPTPEERAEQLVEWWRGFPIDMAVTSEQAKQQIALALRAAILEERDECAKMLEDRAEAYLRIVPADHARDGIVRVYRNAAAAMRGRAKP